MKITYKLLTASAAAFGLVALTPMVFAEGAEPEPQVPNDSSDRGPDNVLLAQTINDDLIVDGRICSSDQNLCAEGENFLSFGPTGFQLEAKLKDNSPAIGFEATGADDADWVIGSNGNDDLRFEYDKNPGGVGDSSLVMAMRVPGLVGINELSPAAPLHVVGPGVPAESTETIVVLESAVSPQQIFENRGTGAEWFFAMTADDQFKVSRNGTGSVEAKFFDNGNLQLAGTLIQSSDVTRKTEFSQVDTDSILDTVAALPITEWSYIGDDARHVGPTAQDFSAAFNLGDTDTGIAAIDADGVALAAIQQLVIENDELRSQVAALGDTTDGSGSISTLSVAAVVLAAMAVLLTLWNRVSIGRRSGSSGVV